MILKLPFDRTVSSTAVAVAAIVVVAANEEDELLVASTHQGKDRVSSFISGIPFVPRKIVNPYGSDDVDQEGVENSINLDNTAIGLRSPFSRKNNDEDVNDTEIDSSADLGVLGGGRQNSRAHSNQKTTRMGALQDGAFVLVESVEGADDEEGKFNHHLRSSTITNVQEKNGATATVDESVGGPVNGVGEIYAISESPDEHRDHLDHQSDGSMEAVVIDKDHNIYAESSTKKHRKLAGARVGSPDTGFCQNTHPRIPETTNMQDLVKLCVNDEYDSCPYNVPIGCWDTSRVTSMKGAFEDLDTFNEPLSYWNVENVVDMTDMFKFSGFNQNISGWRTSNVIKMDYMFARSQFNRDIEDWDTGSVTTMSKMFQNAYEFNMPLQEWDVSSVEDMSSMFDYSSKFNQPLADWNVSTVEDMVDMFRAAQFNQEIDDWDPSSVKNMRAMFYRNVRFNQEIDTWDVSKVTYMDEMFAYSAFNNDLGDWDVSKVSTMPRMFEYTEFNFPLGDWDVSATHSMDRLFRGSMFNQDIGKWDVSSVEQMYQMFDRNRYFNFDISEWDVSRVSTMEEMFSSSAFNQPADKWKVNSVTSMIRMFSGTKSNGYSDFNQCLGSWAEKTDDTLELAYTRDMFVGSDCPDSDKQYQTRPGPWCQGSSEDCSALRPTRRPTNGPTTSRPTSPTTSRPTSSRPTSRTSSRPTRPTSRPTNRRAVRRSVL